MSLEAWGDDDGAGDYDHLIEAGWMTPDEAQEKEAEIAALRVEIEQLKAAQSPEIAATQRMPIQVTCWRPPHLGREIADAVPALVLCSDGTLWSGDGLNWWLLPSIPQGAVK